MATITKLSAIFFLLVSFAHLLSLSSTTEPHPTITASPGVLPYVTAPNISSFFPNPRSDGAMSSAAPPHPEGPVPSPSSGDFVGRRKSATSARLDSTAAIVPVLLYSFLVTCMVVF